MKLRFIVPIIIALIVGLTSIWWFTNRSVLVISGDVVGNDNTTIYLDRVKNGVRYAVDSTTLSDGGEYKFRVKDVPSYLSFYELRLGGDRAPLLGSGGDHVVINSIGKFYTNYTVEGSKESELLRTFYQPFKRQGDELRAIAARYAEGQSTGVDVQDIAREYSDKYREIKQEQLKFVVLNKSSMASIYALFQLLPGDSYMFNEASDAIYMGTVLEAIKESYPDSPYVELLTTKIKESEDRVALLSSANYADFPEINIPDMFGNRRSLTSLKGKVILIDFWSSGFAASNRNNAELKEIYDMYHDNSFEIYQVGVEVDKSQWINTVQSQHLPWISVSDLLGDRSTVLSLYNIQQLPSNVIISKSGDIVARDVYGDKLRALISTEVSK